MRCKPSYTWHDGFAMPMGFPAEAFGSALRYRPSPGDFFIATYPKCGTTWVQHIVYLIAHRGTPLPASARMDETIPHLEEIGAERAAGLPAPRFLKTHLPFSMTPRSEDARYLYVARNPFDCAVSFFHHTRGFVKHYDFADGTFDDYFECFLAGDVDFGDYFDNLLSWLERRGDRSVLVLTYEAISADPRAAVLEIGEFMGAGEGLNETVLDAVLRHSSFASMSRDQQRWSSRRPDGMPAFVRKGVVGDWINHFSPAQARRLLEKADRRLAGSGAESLWPEVFAAARRLADESARSVSE
jgi:hypothetical protein